MATKTKAKLPVTEVRARLESIRGAPVTKDGDNYVVPVNGSLTLDGAEWGGLDLSHILLDPADVAALAAQVGKAAP